MHDNKRTGYDKTVRNPRPRTLKRKNRLSYRPRPCEIGFARGRERRSHRTLSLRAQKVSQRFSLASMGAFSSMVWRGPRPAMSMRGRPGDPSSRQHRTGSYHRMIPQNQRNPHIAPATKIRTNLTANSVQQQPIATPGGSEINHGIHRNPRKRESESTSPFGVLPGGNSCP